MLSRVFLFGLACIWFNSANAIEAAFEGPQPDNANAIVERLVSEANPDFGLLDSLAQALVRNSYLDASVIIKNGSLIVSSGPRYVLTKINLHGDSVKVIQLNRPFDSVNVARAVEELMQSYRDRGYHYVSAQTQDITLNDTSVTLDLILNRGPLVHYGEPLLAGLTRTDEKLVQRFLPENKTGTLTSEYVVEAEKAAHQIPFVKFAPPVTLRPRPGYTVSDVVFNFLEKTPIRFEGAGGLAGEDASQAVWSLAVTLNNLFGQGKQISVISQRRDTRRNTLEVSYAQPVFLIGLGELSFNVHTRDYRNEFYEFALQTGFQSRIRKNFITGLELGWKSVKPELGSTGYNRYTGQFSISRRSFSDEFNPARGLALKWGIDFSFRRYTADQLPAALKSRTFNETRHKFSVSLFQPLPGPVLGHLTLNYKGLETGESLPPLSELVLIGGPGSLRGYRNEQYAVLRTVYGTFEPRFRFNQGYFFAFYDAAYLYNRVPGANGKVIADEQFRWSYGFGLGLGSGRRSLAISLGFNPDFGVNEPRLSIDLSSDI